MATTKTSTMPPRTTLPLRPGGAGRLLRPLLMLLVLALVVAASVAGTWYFMKRMQPPVAVPVQLGVGQPQATPMQFVAPPATPPVVPAPIFIPLEAFTVTLQNADSERILHVGITLRVSDEQTRQRIEKYKPHPDGAVLAIAAGGPDAAGQDRDGARHHRGGETPVLAAA